MKSLKRDYHKVFLNFPIPSYFVASTQAPYFSWITIYLSLMLLKLLTFRLRICCNFAFLNTQKNKTKHRVTLISYQDLESKVKPVLFFYAFGRNLSLITIFLINFSQNTNKYKPISAFLINLYTLSKHLTSSSH